MELLEKMKQERFIRNNGRVLRGINVLRIQYVNLIDLKSGLSSDVKENEYLDSVNYLSEEKYITLRHIHSKEETTLADTELKYLEAKVSGKGIKFLAGKINDECIEW